MPSASGLIVPTTSRPIAELAKMAAAKHGVVSRDQAIEIGLTRSQINTLVARGEWRRPFRGIMVSAAAPQGWLQDAAIATIVTRGGLSHRAAAQVWGLDGIQNAPIEVVVPRTQNVPSGPWITHRSKALDPGDMTVINGLAVTSLPRTVVDLGHVVDDEILEQVLDDAFRHGMSPRALVSTLERLECVRSGGSASLKRVLARPDRLGPLPGSKFERLVERTCRAGGLPVPERQFPVTDADGRIVACLDMAWPEAKLAVEADSLRYHSGAQRVRSDLQRDLILTGLGWAICYVGWQHVQNPASFVAHVCAAYDQRINGRC